MESREAKTEFKKDAKVAVPVTAPTNMRNKKII